MNETGSNRGANAFARTPSSPGGLAVLESQVADLQEENARLQRRLEEAQTSAELEARAERILAIPWPEEE